MSNTVELVRPYEISDAWHKEYWLNKNITVLITQRKTFDITRLCLESLLRFYPDIPILVMDGDSADESLLYLRWKSLTEKNISLVELKGVVGKHNSHGVAMHDCLTKFIKTKYVLLLDSDTIIFRGGFIEWMLDQIQGTDNMFATGTLMEVSNSNDAIGAPKDDEDILRYAHPSCSIIDREKYIQFKSVSSDHGSPLVYVMKEAKELGMCVGYFPVDKYVAHLSGSSWSEPRTVWKHDFGVQARPFISFITESAGMFNQLTQQTGNDFEIITALKNGSGSVILHENLVTVPLENNRIFTSRFNLRGEYVCVLKDGDIISKDLVYLAKIISIDKQAPDEFDILGIKFIRRKVFQNKDAFNAD